MPLPSQKFPVIDQPATNGGKAFVYDAAAISTADSAGLVKSFPASPINTNMLNDDRLRRDFEMLVLRGTIKNKVGLDGAGDSIFKGDVAGYRFSSFNRDYNKNDPPDYKAISAEIANAYRTSTLAPNSPSNPFMPNISSVAVAKGPSPVDVNPNNQQPAPVSTVFDGLKPRLKPQHGGAAFVGDGTLLSPSDSSKRIVGPPGALLLMGKSSAEQEGANTFRTGINKSSE
jgi:hypothetical protein